MKYRCWNLRQLTICIKANPFLEECHIGTFERIMTTNSISEEPHLNLQYTVFNKIQSKSYCIKK